MGCVCVVCVLPAACESVPHHNKQLAILPHTHSHTHLLLHTYTAILTSLRQDDESSQLGALTELCEMLSISSEDTLASFPIESAVPLLVSVGVDGCVGV